MTLALIQFFHQYFNGTPPSKIVKNGAAAYTVYIIQFSILQRADHCVHRHLWKAAGVTIVFSQKTMLLFGGTIDPATGEPSMLPGSYIWAGWLWTLILTQLTVWPLAHYMRQLPVLNKIL